MIADLWQDLHYGVRMLRKSPGLTLTVVLTLALGIGANTAIFSLVDAFLFGLLPVNDPQQLVFVQAIQPNGRTTNSFTLPTFEQFRDRNQSFSGIFAWDNTSVNITVDGQPEIVAGDFVSGSYFDVLGVGAILGRTFTSDDDKPGREPVAVISHPYWERRFARDHAVIGKTIFLGTIPFTVIGVTPPDFFGRSVAGKSADVVLPMFMQSRLALRDHTTFQIMARLKPGISPEQACADLDVIHQQALMQAAGSRIPPQSEQRIRAQRIGLEPGLRGENGKNNDFATELPILFAVVALVLLIACVNIANLLLARAAARQKEIAVRLSLGASRGRLIRQLLTESLLLAALGGVLGLLFAEWGAGVLLTFLSSGESIPFDLRPDVKILAFTGALSLLTGMLFGLTPALSATRVNLSPILKGAEGDAETRPVRHRLAKSLVVAQVALSLTLLVSAGLLINSLRKLYAVDTGFEREKVLTTWVYPSLLGYDHAKEMGLYRELLDRIDTIPGVQSVSLSRRALTVAKGGNVIGPRFFETMGIGLLQGREFTNADTADSPKVAIISESIARSLFPEEHPLGQLLPDEFSFLGDGIQVVGVVKDTRSRLRQSTWDEAIYIPYTQVRPEGLGQIKLFIRTADNPTGIIPALRREVSSVEKDLALRDLKTQAAEMNDFIGEERSLATLLSFFGALALVLSSLGLYGTMSYAVSRRTKELGIRLALGAQKKDVLWMVLREVLLQVIAGIAVGTLLTLITTRLIANMLFGVQTTDPLTIALAIVVMLTIALIAGYLPARRATKVDPMVALRYE